MVSRRSLEAFAGIVLLVFGIAVIVQSLDVGAGWSSGGVDAGTFPLLTGVLICAGSLVNLGRAFVRPDAPLIAREELRRSAGLLLPALAFVAAIPVIGLYAATAAYLVGVLHVQHRLNLLRAVAIAAATVLALYAVFERTFQILMPRGWLGNMLGY